MLFCTFQATCKFTRGIFPHHYHGLITEYSGTIQNLFLNILNLVPIPRNILGLLCLFIMKSWTLGIETSFSGMKGFPLENLDYITLHCMPPSTVVLILLDKLPGSVSNQSMSTIAQQSSTVCKQSRGKENVNVHWLSWTGMWSENSWIKHTTCPHHPQMRHSGHGKTAHESFPTAGKDSVEYRFLRTSAQQNPDPSPVFTGMFSRHQFVPRNAVALASRHWSQREVIPF